MLNLIYLAIYTILIADTLIYDKLEFIINSPVKKQLKIWGSAPTPRQLMKNILQRGSSLCKQKFLKKIRKFYFVCCREKNTL